MTKQLIYILSDMSDRCITYFGIPFQEFASNLPRPLGNLLVLSGDYTSENFDYNSRCHFARRDKLDEILNEDVYSYGDFAWVDFQDEKSLDSLKPREIADLLYIGRLFKPVTSPFYSGIENRFVYLAHDDGWFNRIYCKDFEEFASMLGNLITERLDCIKEGVPLIPLDISNELIALGQEGLLLDLGEVGSHTSVHLDFYIIGKCDCIDPIYSKLNDYKTASKMKGQLTMVQGDWRIEYI